MSENSGYAKVFMRDDGVIFPYSEGMAKQIEHARNQKNSSKANFSVKYKNLQTGEIVGEIPAAPESEPEKPKGSGKAEKAKAPAAPEA